MGGKFKNTQHKQKQEETISFVLGFEKKVSLIIEARVCLEITTALLFFACESFADCGRPSARCSGGLFIWFTFETEEHSRSTDAPQWPTVGGTHPSVVAEDEERVALELRQRAVEVLQRGQGRTEPFGATVGHRSAAV